MNNPDVPLRHSDGRVQSSPSGFAEWLFMFYGAATLWFCGYWLLGRHGSDSVGEPLDWFSLELTAGMAIAVTSMVALVKPTPRLRVPGAVTLAIFHSVLWTQWLVGSSQNSAWALLPIGYSLALVGALIHRHGVRRSTRPN